MAPATASEFPGARLFKVARTGKLRRVHPTHLPLPAGESILIGLVAAVVVLVPLLGLPAAHFSGMTREGAHALLAAILGLSVAEIILDRHSGGRTSVVGEGLRVVLVFLIGYLGPSLFGLGAARLISLGYAVAVLWLLVVILVGVLFLLRRSFGLLLEQRPRAQSRGTAMLIPHGHGLVFTTRDRPVESSRGWSAAPVRHGVSVIRSGERYTLGLVFHDAASIRMIDQATPVRPEKC